MYELSTEECKKVIEEVKDLGARMLIFDGGEPTMREDLIELIKYAYDLGLDPLLGTNGTLITRDYAEKLRILLEDESLWKSISREARNYAENFDHIKITKRYMALYRGSEHEDFR